MAFTGDYEPSGTQWVREQVEQIVRTGTTEGVMVRDLPIVLVTYRGVKTGKVRKTPLMRVEHDGSYAAVASQGGAPVNPQWYTSLVANPVVEVQDGAASGEYRAREVTGEEKAEWWRHAVAAYPPYADYQEKTDRQIPVFVLEPVA
ncbi:MAG TPA: nitroreductase family deazaflavin-dependent oxidoreductase [Streptosporangiaceae bacterium]|jgi:deazaflavin-dependent oxidoreductase (nitroreductase family)